ncbi:glycosyltransferase [Lacibacter sp. H375]|uniref:glycosyltransferase n=1 Tax=Lacibacter sp. H375 TaxID=3133424 RepID=UPI0030C04F81
MKILWLCSWYPHSIDPYDGDFIERQAKALSAHTQVDLIHVVQNFDFLKKETSLRTEEKQEGQLHSSVYFLPLTKTTINFFQKLLFNKEYQSLYKKLIADYISKNGKPDLIHLHVPVKAGSVVVKMKKEYDIPFVVTEHSSAYFEHIPENYFNRNRYFRFITKQSFEEAVAVSSVSDWLLKRLNTLFNIMQTKLIRNVVDTSVFYPVEIKNDRPRFIHVSMMHELKNVKGILHALAALKEKNVHWEMWFVGPVLKENTALAQQLGISDQITWKGALSYRAVAECVRSADALVHFSNYENLPCVINEALCCGLPVISSNVGGIAELVNSSNGVLIAPGDVTTLTNTLEDFLQQKINYNKTEIAANAANQFNENIIGKQLLDWYQELLAKK